MRFVRDSLSDEGLQLMDTNYTNFDTNRIDWCPDTIAPQGMWNKAKKTI
jgi:hypothetical protein